LFFWAPSVIPVKAIGVAPCGAAGAWLTADTAFAATFIPCPAIGQPTPTPWVVIAIGASVVSVMLNAAIVSRTQCRELTLQEAYSSVFLPFVGIANKNNHHCHH
jgi:hypothetical protein